MCGAGGEKSALQGSGLIRTVGPCAQRRMALMPRAIETHCRTIGTKVPCISRGLLSRRGLFFVILVSSPVATFEQSENVAIAGTRPEQLLAMRGVVSETASICAYARYDLPR